MWKSIGAREIEFGMLFVCWLDEQMRLHEEGWLPNPLEIAKSSVFIDSGKGEDDIQTMLGMVLWIKTARAASYPNNWLPGPSDLTKSALFERIRSGSQPLAEPPPLGMSCPWYAIVEDQGPHYAYDATFGSLNGWLKENQVSIYQNPYDILERIGEKRFLIKDGRRDTSYRFDLWYDEDWKHPSNSDNFSIVGGWFVQNIKFRWE